MSPSKTATAPPPAPAAERVTPAVGSRAPALQLPADDGSVVDLHQSGGAWTVVYFYPKDDTPGCTIEACDFRDRYERFAAAGCRVIGVSPDPGKRHLRFREKYALPFILATDEGKETLQAWGAWGDKTFMGRKMVGVLRSTYLVDPAGQIAAAWPKVAVKGHVDAVLAALAAARAT